MSTSCSSLSLTSADIDSTEVVLSILLMSFKFEDSGKKIMWKMPGITSPAVQGKDVTRPALPMKISIL
jgi:hypothetical protein